jgi:HEAT repeat protein
MIFILDRPPMTVEQAEVLVDALLPALRDDHPGVREAAVGALFSVVQPLATQVKAVPHLEAIVSAMAEALGDTSQFVRWHAALALAHIYFIPPDPNPHPLPKEPGYLVQSLCGALRAPEADVQNWAFQVLRAIAPRLGGPPPPALVAALDAPEENTRAEAAQTVVKFPEGLDPILPALLRMLEHDPSSVVRSSCDMALIGPLKFSPAVVPVLAKALRSPERRVRFRTADRLSYIFPRPVETIPELLPLLQEHFKPVTPSEQKNPAWADPAVAACWALGGIARGAPTASQVEDNLTKLLRDSEHPWRQAEAKEALERIGSPAKPGKPAERSEDGPRSQ